MELNLSCCFSYMMTLQFLNWSTLTFLGTRVWISLKYKFSLNIFLLKLFTVFLLFLENFKIFFYKMLDDLVIVYSTPPTTIFIAVPTLHLTPLVILFLQVPQICCPVFSTVNILFPCTMAERRPSHSPDLRFKCFCPWHTIPDPSQCKLETHPLWSPVQIFLNQL